MYVAITSTCPYHCPHCSYGRRPNSTLSTTQLLGLIKELKSLGTAIIGFTGGEPLLHDDIETLVSAAGPEMTTVLFTTGYQLDSTRAKNLMNAGIGSIVIGIESTNPKEHDAIRGKPGSFIEAETAIKTCIDSGIYTAIETIGTREKIQSGELEKIYQMGRRLSIGEIRILSPITVGLWTGCQDVMLRPEELSVLENFTSHTIK